MSVEIEFPFEFIVEGVPVSLQAKRAKTRENWMNRIRVAARECLPPNHFATDHPMEVTIYYFSDTKAGGDLDNLIKPILDSLEGCIYIDDSQVERILIQRFEPCHIDVFEQVTEKLAEAREMGGQRVYIRIDESGA